MKYFLGIAAFVLMFGSCWGQNYPDSGFTNKAEAKNLMVNGKKEGKWVEYTCDQVEFIRDTNAPFYVLTMYKKGTIIGMIHVYFKKSGALRELIPFINGKMNGIGREYNIDGELECERPYIDGEENGVEKNYYTSGELYMETTFKKGKRNGLQKLYYKSGKLLEEDHFKNDNEIGISKVYFEEGKVNAEYPYKKGERNGVAKMYYYDGKIMNETPYKNGVDGEIKCYDENGKEIK